MASLVYLVVVLLVLLLFVAMLVQPIVALIECASSSLSFTKKFFWLLTIIIVWGPASWMWGVLNGGRISKLLAWVSIIVTGFFVAVYLVVDEKTLNDLQPNATLPSLPTSIESHTQQSPDPRPLSQTAEGSRASLRSSQQPDVESIKAFNASARSFHGMLETRLPELQNVITSMDILLARVRERRPDHPALLPCHKTIERIRDSATNIEATRTLLSSLSPLVTDCERSLSPRCAEVSKAAEELEGLLAKQNEINAEALILQVECRSTLTKQS